MHIDSVRRTFDQSLMNIFQRVQEILSGQESVTEGQADGQTGEPTKIAILSDVSLSFLTKW